MSEIKPCPNWTCFHCGETFTTPGSARDHFGFDPSCDPACRIKLGAERGLVMALRKAEADCEEMRRLLHDEASEAYRLYASQATRHRDQIMAAEESGYEKGLTDGRVEADRASDACASVQRERDELRDFMEEAKRLLGQISKSDWASIEEMKGIGIELGPESTAFAREIDAFLARYEAGK